ncbi:MAG: hypothetical protein V1660_03935 [archaeon]
MKRGFLSLKKAETMGMPFQMIFSLFLIAVFFVVAFFSIMNFLSVQNCAQVGLFQRELQEKIDSIWNAQSAENVFEGKLPGSVEYVCFLNFTRPKTLTGLDSEGRDIANKVYNDLSVFYKFKKANLFLYPTKGACDMSYKLLKHIDASSTSNPYCIKNTGKISISLYKGFDDVYVKVRQQ